MRDTECIGVSHFLIFEFVFYNEIYESFHASRKPFFSVVNKLLPNTDGEIANRKTHERALSAKLLRHEIGEKRNLVARKKKLYYNVGSCKLQNGRRLSGFLCKRFVKIAI